MDAACLADRADRILRSLRPVTGIAWAGTSFDVIGRAAGPIR
ncbi:hypothetical protein [Neoroseomonas soli]|nr:hypothetical protein [Neoroseomonas soli]